jgi:hypothetical protein
MASWTCKECSSSQTGNGASCTRCTLPRNWDNRIPYHPKMDSDANKVQPQPAQSVTDLSHWKEYAETNWTCHSCEWTNYGVVPVCWKCAEKKLPTTSTNPVPRMVPDSWTPPRALGSNPTNICCCDQYPYCFHRGNSDYT